VRSLILVVLVAWALSGCGVGEGAVHVAGEDQVPWGLLDPGARVASTTTLPELAQAPVTIWLATDAAIVPVHRSVASPASPRRVLESVETGPTEGEAALGLRSLVPAPVVQRDVVGAVVTVELATTFTTTSPHDQLLGLAQIVYSLTELDQVRSVRFVVSGESVEVPTSDGSLSDGPVGRPAFASLVAGRSTVTDP
jgi:spore germination protein GerM